ncbi:MAG: hypothetical protein JXA82_12720 [Sedimentisphaerales bacterium]|nr:hypothetical protein [Sedimentisphaerales bacterium]
MKLNWNSLLTGLLLGICLTLLLGAAEFSSGRYQLSGSSTIAWIIDTETGQVWVTEKRSLEPDSSLVYVEKPKWYNYGFPSENTVK